MQADSSLSIELSIAFTQSLAKSWPKTVNLSLVSDISVGFKMGDIVMKLNFRISMCLRLVAQDLGSHGSRFFFAMLHWLLQTSRPENLNIYRLHKILFTDDNKEKSLQAKKMRFQTRLERRDLWSRPAARHQGFYCSFKRRNTEGLGYIYSCKNWKTCVSDKIIMMVISTMQYRALHQEPGRMTIVQKGFLCFVIQMFSGWLVVSNIFTTVSGKVCDCLNHKMQSLLALKNSLYDLEHLASWNVSFRCC